MANGVSIGTVYGIMQLREQITQAMPPVVRQLQAARAGMGDLAKDSGAAAIGLNKIPPAAQGAATAIKQATSATSGLSTTLKAAGGVLAAAFSVGAIVAASRKVLDFAGDISDLSAKTGIGTRALQEFKYAGGQVGVSLETITSGINQMQNRIAEGDKSAVGALRRLNISVKDFKTLKPEDQFSAVAEAVAQIQDPAERVRTAMDLMGKSGADLLPVLTSHFNEARVAARQLGIVLDDETIAALDGMGDRIDTLSAVSMAGFARLLVQLEPLLKVLVGGLVESGKWLKYLQDQFQLVLLGAGALTADLADLEVEFYELAKSINPAARMMGTFDDAIADARKRAADARTWTKLKADSIQRDATRAIIALAKLGEQRGVPVKGSGGTGAPSDAEIKRFAAWRDEVTGAARDKALQQLARDWAKLTDAERDSQPVRDAVMAQYEKLRVSLPQVGGALEDLRTKNLKALQPLEGLQQHLQALAMRAIPDANRMFVAGQAALDGFQRNGLLVSRRLVDISTGMTAVPAALFTKDVKLAAKQVEDWGSALGDVARVLDDVGHALGASGDWVRDIARVTAGYANLLTAVKAVKAAEASGDRAAQLSAWASGVGAIIGLYSTLSGIIEKMAHRKQVTQTLANLDVIGLNLSREDAEALVAEGIRTYRDALTHLDALIAQQGGVTIHNAAQFTKLLAEALQPHPAGNRRLGMMNLEDLSKQIESVFPQLAKVAVENGSLASAALVDIIHRVQDLGIESAAVASFIRDQQSSALSGLQEFADARSSVVKDLADARKHLDDLVKDKGPAKEIAAAKKEVAELNAALAAIPITAEGAIGIGASLAAIFAEGQRQGRPMIDLLREIGPVAEQYAEHFAMAGVTGGAAFEQIRRLAAIASSEISGPAVAAISGLTQALTGMHNSGGLTQEMFTGITSELVALKAGLESTGVSSGDALTIMQDGLQTAWELWKDHNYVVDDATKKLLEEAEAAGVVGETHRTVQEQMLLATLEMRDAVVGLAEMFGVNGLTGAVNDFGSAIGNLPDKVTIKGNFDWEGGFPEMPDDWQRERAGGEYGSGGIVPHAEGAYIRKDHTARVHAGELIGPVSFMSDALAGAMAKNGGSRDGSRGSGGDTHLNVVIHAIDAKSFEDMLRDREKAKAVTMAMLNNVSEGGDSLDGFARAVRYTTSVARR